MIHEVLIELGWSDHGNPRAIDRDEESSGFRLSVKGVVALQIVGT
jgi:hypothetical protein